MYSILSCPDGQPLADDSAQRPDEDGDHTIDHNGAVHLLGCDGQLQFINDYHESPGSLARKA